MASDPALAIRTAVIAALRSGEHKVYDEVPANAPTRYFTVGPIQVLPEEDDYDADPGEPGCRSLASETILQLDAWSRDQSHQETGEMCGQAREILRGRLVVEGHVVVLHALQDTQYLKDPDGQTSHGVMRFRFLTEPA